MKTFTKVLLFILTVAQISAQEADGNHATTRVARLETIGVSRVQPFDEAKELAIKFWLQQLMLSALYRNVVQDSSVGEWEQRSSAPLRIHCRYSVPTTIALPERRVLVFDEVLLPLPDQRYPDYIFIKHGQRVLRLAKFDPWVLRKLVSEAGFSLYPSLASVERALF